MTNKDATRWQKFWAWLVKYWQVFAGIIGTLAGVAIVVLFKRNQAACERREVSAEVAANLRDVAKAQGRREAVRERIRSVDEQLAKVDLELDDDTKRLRVNQENMKGMTVAEKIKRFKELGY